MMNMQDAIEQIRQDLLETAEQQHQEMIKKINAAFGVQEHEEISDSEIPQ